MVNSFKSSQRAFGYDETHKVLPRDGAGFIASSDGLDWRSLYVSAQREEPFQGVFQARDPLIVLFRSVSGCGTRPAGALRIVPASTPMTVNLHTPLDTVHLYVRREVWDEVAIDMIDGDPAAAQLRPQFVHSDPMLFALADAALAAVQSDCCDPTFSDHLARSIAAHLMICYVGSKIERKRLSASGGVYSREVVRAIDFMEANAERSIGLQEIAAAAVRSPSHLARIFATEVGVPPHQYLIRIRVKRAQKLLMTTGQPIAEIALDCGFSHQEHLTRLFRRHFSSTPAAFRRLHRS